MDVETAKYFGYSLQLLLVLVLVISLACKSWGLLIVCLVAAIALLAMVCYQMVRNNQGFENIQLIKKNSALYTSRPSVQTMDINEPTNLPQVHMEPMTPMTPGIYQPPIHKERTRDEQTALQLMSMTDRGVNMHAPVRNDYNQYIVPTSQGLDLHPHTNAYIAPATAQAPLPIHLDEMHPDNPMNSLSYLRQS